MRFQINNKILEKFPRLNVAVLVCNEIDNQGKAKELIKFIRSREEEIRKEFNAETLSQNPKFTCWREAYRVFGVKPKKYRSSVEALYRRVLKGEEIRPINKIVDIYNYISLKYTVPAGGEDLDKIKGNIQLTFAGEDEPSVLLLGDKEPKPPKEGEAIYKDEISAICRCFNWREAERTKFTEQTQKAIIVIEGLPPTTRKEIEKILEATQKLTQKFCGGKIIPFILDKENPEIKF